MIGEKLKQFLIEGTRKRKIEGSTDSLTLLRRKYGVAFEEENDKELKN